MNGIVRREEETDKSVAEQVIQRQCLYKLQKNNHR